MINLMAKTFCQIIFGFNCNRYPLFIQRLNSYFLRTKQFPAAARNTQTAFYYFLLPFLLYNYRIDQSIQSAAHIYRNQPS